MMQRRKSKGKEDGEKARRETERENSKGKKVWGGEVKGIMISAGLKSERCKRRGEEKNTVKLDESRMGYGNRSIQRRAGGCACVL